MTAEKPLEMFPLYCRSLYISIKKWVLRLRARTDDKVNAPTEFQFLEVNLSTQGTHRMTGAHPLSNEARFPASIIAARSFLSLIYLTYIVRPPRRYEFRPLDDLTRGTSTPSELSYLSSRTVQVAASVPRQ